MLTHLLELLGLVRSDDLQMGWAIAVPIVASVISGLLSNKGKKSQQKSAEKTSDARRAYAMQQLSPAAISETAQYLFPGLLPPAARKGGRMLSGNVGQNLGGGFSVGSNSGAWQPHAGGTPFQGTSEFNPHLVGGGKSGTMTAGGARGEIGATNTGGFSGPWGAGNANRATGGPVEGGQPYIVGEQGPEVVVPQQPGNVIPNPTTQMTMANSAATNAIGSNVQAGGSAAPPTLGGTPKGGQPAFQPGPQPTVDPKKFGGGGGGALGGPLTVGSGAMGGANANAVAAGDSQYPGGMVMQRMMEYLKNPGQIDSSAYEREQEQVNQGLNYAQRGIGGELMGHGIDPNSGYGQMLSQSAALNAMKMKNEANRDFTQMSETMRRTDIDRGTQSYLNFLSTVFGVNNARANTASSAGSNIIPQFGDPYAGMASAVGFAGNTLGQYFASKKQPKTT